jgi:hypothetical protein
VAHVDSERGVAVADRRGRVRAQAGIQLDRSLEPGDYVLAGTFGQSGRVPRWERPLAYLAIVLWALGLSWFVALLVAGELLPGGITAGIALPCMLASAPSARRKPTYIAVTTRYVYLVRMTWTGRTAVRIVLQTPIRSIHLTAEWTGRFQRVVRFEGPDFPPRGLQFLIAGAWCQELDTTRAWLREAGAAIADAPRTSRSHLDTPQ